MRASTIDPGIVWSHLDNRQRARLEQFEEELVRLNGALNLISRATTDDVRCRHTLHCLALAAQAYPDGSTIVDWGTGGGLPAIPLAICFEGVSVVAVDATKRKVLAVKRMARLLGLSNLTAWAGRAEDWPGYAHYSVSRATAPLATLWAWHRRVATTEGFDASRNAWRPGLICLKGGNLKPEVDALTPASPSLHANLTRIESADCTLEDKHVVHVGQS